MRERERKKIKDKERNRERQRGREREKERERDKDRERQKDRERERVTEERKNERARVWRRDGTEGDREKEIKVPPKAEKRPQIRLSQLTKRDFQTNFYYSTHLTSVL